MGSTPASPDRTPPGLPHAHAASVAELSLFALRAESLQPVFDSAAASIAAALSFDGVGVYELFAESSFTLRAGSGWSAGFLGATPPGDMYSSLAVAIGTDDPVVWGAQTSDADAAEPDLGPIPTVMSGAAARLMAGERPFGLLAVFSRRVRQFRPDELALLRWTAEVLSATIGRVHGEQALRAGQERVRAAVDSAAVMIWTGDTRGRRDIFNERWLEFRGRTLSEESGEGWLRGVHPQDRQSLEQKLRGAYSRLQPFNVEYRLRRADGEYRWILDQGSPHMDADGRITSYSGAATDVTSRQQSETAVRESQSWLAGVIASAMDAIIAIDEDQRIVLFNRAAEHVFRCEAADVLGEPIDQLIPERFRDAHREHVRRFGEGGITMRRMGRLQPLSGLRADGEEFPIEASISHAEFGGKRIYTVILRDISERTKLQEQLLHSQKLLSVGRLAGGIAHDFNNVLTAIFGYLELIRQHPDATEPIRAALDSIRDASQKAADLTAKLLAFARKQVIEPRVVDLNQLVRGVIGMLSRLLGEHIEIVHREDPSLPHVRVDPGQFEHVLVNLAVNARDAMPHGGKFILETATVEIDDEFTRIRPEMKPGTYAMLAVSDTGIGMDPVTLEHCFEPFFTTKDRGKGTGLGLASCHGIVSQARGHIWVYSELGRGTSFKIHLPACHEKSPLKPRNGGQTNVRGSETVLLVEDDVLVRDVAAGVLRDRGYIVIEAGSAGQALKLAEQHRDRIHLLITDVVMPELSGPDLAERLRSTHPTTRVLYTSGYTDDMIAHHGVLEAGVWFLPKPFTPTGLSLKVREVLDAAAPVPEAR